MSAKKVILVTGSNGLAGHAIQAVLKDGEQREDEEWHFVDIEDADLLDSKATMQLFERIKPSHVIHLAAAVGGLFFYLRRPLEMFRNNMFINDNVLYASYMVGAKKVISTMTCAALPSDAPNPMNETSLHLGLPPTCMLGYGMSKRMVDIINRFYNDLGDRLFTSVIPSNMFGPHDNFNLQDGHVVGNIIHKTHIAKSTSTPLTVLGTGSASRQFMYSIDFAKLMIWAIREYEDAEPIIFAPNEDTEMTIREMVSIVTGAMKFEGDIQFDTTKSDGKLKWTMNNGKLRKYLPDFKFTPFPEAVKRTTEWFIDNIATART